MVSMRRHLWAPDPVLHSGCRLWSAPQQMAESILRARRSWDTSKSHSVQCGAGERDWDYVCYDHIVSLVPGPPPRNVKLGVNITLDSVKRGTGRSVGGCTGAGASARRRAGTSMNQSVAGATSFRRVSNLTWP